MNRTEVAYKVVNGNYPSDRLGSYMIGKDGLYSFDGNKFTAEELGKYRQLVNDGYTLWLDGGECPVDEGVLVDVVYKDHNTESSKAKYLTWSHCLEYANIIAYKVVEAEAEKPDVDMVNNPPHYQILPGVEVYDIRCALMDKIQGATHAQVSDWDRAVEYLLRMWDKNGIQDAKKARWYLDKLIEKLERRAILTSRSKKQSGMKIN